MFVLKIQVGLTYVRGCEIEGLLDETGKLIEEGKKSVRNLILFVSKTLLKEIFESLE